MQDLRLAFCSFQKSGCSQDCNHLLQAEIDPDRLKSSLKDGLNQRGRRLVGLGLKPSKLAIPGSNPGDRTKRILASGAQQEKWIIQAKVKVEVGS